ncbi:hypothetical protein GCM10010172_22440 [Paractinoplanes ferrugineus]|uniref:DUF4190 domain-containing protein n=1 Tax=Paractinoplanes ferrugineus TaxID=113564 RepID=A0A919ITR6_9ACTN|nr:hypothetical protein [Actinoplanes ferrugineus]GIE08845.1 hypothetical protein Afe05nite_06850 [Actinoplanes ferrugineus]
MRLPTFSRQTETDAAEADRPTTASPATTTDTPARAGTPVRPRSDDDTTADLRPKDRTVAPPPPPAAVKRWPDNHDTAETPKVVEKPVVAEKPVPVVTGPKPRASLLATLGLILGVASILLVLSGPLLGYGIGVAGLALILSLGGLRATGKRHVAGKSDALLGTVLSLGAIVLGVLALTGSLSWLGTDLQPVNTLREWLDSQFLNRF